MGPVMAEQENLQLGVVTAAECELGRLLRLWRAKRDMSQLDLAMTSGVSSRHIAFLETGRAGGSVETVLRLAEALDVPLRERNRFLTAAGFAPMYRETGLDSQESERVYKALDAFLMNQEPFPAIVLDRNLNIIANNPASDRINRLYFDPDKLWGDGPRRTMDLLLSMNGYRPWLENWDEVANWYLGQTYQEAHSGIGDPVMKAVLDQALSFPGVADVWKEPEAGVKNPPVFSARLRKFGVSIELMCTYMTFGTSEDAFVQELRIMCTYPANDLARRFAKWVEKTQGKRPINSFR
jgi:transcriptional regulator with XRE-family HTH domain